MFNIVKHFWLLITIKKYIKKYKLKVKVRNYFNSIRITTNTNSLNFITLTEKSNYEKKVKEIRRSNVSAQIILWSQMLIIEKYSMSISNYWESLMSKIH